MLAEAVDGVLSAQLRNRFGFETTVVTVGMIISIVCSLVLAAIMTAEQVVVRDALDADIDKRIAVLDGSHEFLHCRSSDALEVLPKASSLNRRTDALKHLKPANSVAMADASAEVPTSGRILSPADHAAFRRDGFLIIAILQNSAE